jgi:putative phosphonate metabolism protein
MAARYAVYFAPPATESLWERASMWLGRDAATGALFEGPVAGMDRDRLLNFTGAPSRYGFHATLRAPMRLQPEVDDASLRSVLADFSARHLPFDMGPMRIALVDGFVAIVPETQPEQVSAFAQDLVETLEPLRAPLSERELQRRLSADLSARQRELLDRFGYPYVAEAFQFHMTLTDRLDPAAADEIATAARTWFAPVLEEARWLDRLSLFVEPEPAQDFRRVRDFPLGAPS